MGRTPAKPIPQKRDNPLRGRNHAIRAPTIFTQQAEKAAAAVLNAKKSQTAKKNSCGDPTCTNSVIVDGTCIGCGKVVEDNNIVAEVQFGESGNGAAVVQGSYIGADQGGARSSGPGFPRAGGGSGEEGREATVREGKRIMQSMAMQFEIPHTTVDIGGQIFKLAAMNNFVQGRRMDVVCGVCLYSACRQEERCKVMLIDFADRLQINVFKLGRTFKALHAAVSIAKNGINPVLPEDLIWRFASKLEFGKDCNKVAEDAIRMAQRMSLDWMVMGRRPSGVCGACIILAARMNNYRRSITEVVYIVKVTTHTIQKRLDEFKMTPSSALTVDEFLNNEFLESSHDPPSFYEKTDEFQKNKKRRKRKRYGHDGLEGVGEDEDEAESVDDENQGNKRQRTGAAPNPEHALPTIELRRDADGFAIPPPPTKPSSQSEETRQADQSSEIPIDPDLVDEIIADHTETSFQRLVENFGDAGADGENHHAGSISGSISSGSINKLEGMHTSRFVYVPDEWASDERVLANQMSEIISDPSTVEHATEYAAAEKRVAKHMALAMISQRIIPSTPIIGEEEFADDAEVQNFILSPEEAAKKEKAWINLNKDWLRGQQIKEYQKRQEAKGPPKARRIRKKKPRIGEGQTSVASSPGEAVAGVMKARNFSRKFNYSAFTAMFNDVDPGLGSAATSRVASRAGSELGESTPASTAATPAASVAGSVPGTPAANEDSEMGDPDDYDNPDDYVDPDAEGSVRAESVADDREDWQAQLKTDRDPNQDGEDLPEDDTEYAETGFGDERHPFDEEDGAFDGPEDFDDE
ncbi:Transcription factor IIIB 70 kDa subunit [Lachnellula occidentalis]|uniref:B-related factor 1 n=1 Tax=Lachnellula occidentalis TaxID=215460 RepID=A0A8H8UH15_9HELO|nr:Transcription factor IIIB 70 kDa subunit [Lachnellula occidentalis]